MRGFESVIFFFFFARQGGLVWRKVKIRDDTVIMLPVVEPRIIRSRSRMRNIR